jgi:hypothetical protein
MDVFPPPLFAYERPYRGASLPYTVPATVNVYPNKKNGLVGLIVLILIILLIWWLVKRMRPTTVAINGRPVGNAANFTFNGPGPFMCSLDGGDEMPCTSPFQLQDLPSGEHNLQVRVGNKTAQKTWTVA